MLFNSDTFIFLFLPVTLLGFYISSSFGKNGKIVWLLFASMCFYAYWSVAYLALLLISISLNFLFGYLLKTKNAIILCFGVMFNLGIIFYYKYIIFAAEVFNFGENLFTGILLPLGISFYTFQQISYLVDVYRGRSVRQSFLEYVLYVSFFPQLIAGPIVYQADLVKQYSRSRFRLSVATLGLGVTVFAIGLFKKVVIADGISYYVAPVFVAAEAGKLISFLEAWGGVLAYTFQIYFDFSGYSDMAVGLGLMFGLRLPINFNSPYKSTSIIEFWNRWHRSLSRFLREYLYFPLGGNRRGFPRQAVNIMIVMLLGGLWHGAGWTFIVWGGLHGFYLLVNHTWRRLRPAMANILPAPAWWTRALSWTMTFVVVVVAWLFFRAESMDGALNILRGMMGLDGRLLLPESYAPYLSPLAGLFDAVGGKFVNWDASFVFYGHAQMGPLLALLVLVLGFPNTQNWIGLVDRGAIAGWPGFDESLIRVRWRPSPLWGGVLGGAMGFTLLWMLSDFGTEFLYFQF